jgi:polygalacturonase
MYLLQNANISILIATLLTATTALTSGTIFNVKDYGAKGDGVTLNTKAIMKAMEDVKKNNGGTLLFPAGGKYLTGALNLTSNLIFKVETDATVLGSWNGTDWPLVDAGKVWPQFGHGSDCTPGTPECRLMHQAFLFAWHKENITLTGGGMVNGNANASNWWKCAKQLALEPCNNHARPHLLMFADTDNIVLKHIRFENSPDWSLHFSSCNNVHIDEISVYNPKDAHNSDGIDIDCTTNVIVENSYFSVGDDAIAIKSGIDYFGRMFNKPSRNIIYRNNVIEQGHGLSIGSETSGSIFNVTFENLFLKGTDRGPRIKSCRGRGGHIDGIVYRNITGENVDTSISFDFDYESGLKPTNKSATPALSNVLLENIQFKNSVNMAGEFNGLPESPFVNITLRNVTTTGRSSGKFGHCDNVVNAICEGMDQEQCPPCFKNV